MGQVNGIQHDHSASHQIVQITHQIKMVQLLLWDQRHAESRHVQTPALAHQ